MRIFENLIIDKTNLKVINSENCTFVPLQLNDYRNLNLETFGSLLKKKQVEATEIDENGVVNKIKVKNYSSDFLILHDGEIIVGAKQNRTIDKSVILKPKETRNIDVLCVEKGRWSFRNHEFSQHNSKLSPEIRFSKETVTNYNKQNTVWNEIDKMYKENNQYSNTSDFCEFKKEENSKLGLEEIKSKIFNDRYNGILVTNNKISFIETFYNSKIYEDQIAKSISTLIIKNKYENNRQIELDKYLLRLKDSNWFKENQNSLETSYLSNNQGKGRLIFLNNQIIHLIFFFH
tara:strand:- start:1023 stop:1892 length:870 start_codon:yes stop_codon:yes gene_type:complete